MAKEEEAVAVVVVEEEGANFISNMAAASNAEHTQLQDMEEDVGMEEREMDSEDNEEEDMGEENVDDEEDDSSEDEKENEAEIQRLEEQVHGSKLTLADELTGMNEWMLNMRCSWQGLKILGALIACGLN